MNHKYLEQAKYGLELKSKSMMLYKNYNIC